MGKKTVIVGATPNQSRYAYLAAGMLTEYGHEIVPLGIRKGEVFGKEILDIRTKPVIKDVDTITIYLSPVHQPEWYEYLLGLKPKRIIFNPGTENDEFERLVEGKGIEGTEACTLVLLRSRQF
ncbi:MAG TPA: CoA-binding protein [Cyclobacteriaceae bacterium]|nr:CoA-binding protein [Cyclobacteriaceae bacterium]